VIHRITPCGVHSKPNPKNLGKIDPQIIQGPIKVKSSELYFAGQDKISPPEQNALLKRRLVYRQQIPPIFLIDHILVSEEDLNGITGLKLNPGSL
jgi:hypothetical protein